MAKSTISLPRDGNGVTIQAFQPIANNNTVKFSPAGADANSGAITANVVRIAVSANMNIEFGAAAVGTTSLFMPANTVEYFAFTSGQAVHAIGTGDVYVTPVA